MQYDGATGWLVGEPHDGMRAMFTMMNNARLGVEDKELEPQRALINMRSLMQKQGSKALPMYQKGLEQF